MFANRMEAGQELIRELREHDISFEVVLGIPRGGVVLAGAIAAAFSCPLDIVMAKKMGSPNLPEYAVGAVTPDGEILVHERLKSLVQKDTAAIKNLAEQAKDELNRQLRMFRDSQPGLSLQDKKVLLVDDGIATGFTIRAAIQYLRRQGVNSITVAVPVCSYNAYFGLLEEADKLIALKVPENFYAVAQYYQDFTAVEDQEVVGILQKVKKVPGNGGNP